MRCRSFRLVSPPGARKVAIPSKLPSIARYHEDEPALIKD